MVKRVHFDDQVTVMNDDELKIVESDKTIHFPLGFVIWIVVLLVSVGFGIAGTIVAYKKFKMTGWFIVLITLLVLSPFTFVTPVLWVLLSIVLLVVPR